MPNDFTVENHGTIFLLTPHTPEAQEWIEAHVPPDAQTWAGLNSIVVEHRYIADIVAGIRADGLEVV